MKFSKLPLCLAIATAMGTVTTVYANSDDNGGNGHERGGSSVDIDKRINVSQDVAHVGEIYTVGLVLVDSTGMAVSEVKQKSRYNEVKNDFDTQNTAGADGDVLNGAVGNMGLNIAAGDNNIQQNSVALSATRSPGITVDVEVAISDSNSFSASDSYNSSKTLSESDSHSKSKSFSKGGSRESAYDSSASGTWSKWKSHSGNMSHNASNSESSETTDTSGYDVSGTLDVDKSKTWWEKDNSSGSSTTTLPGQGEADPTTVAESSFEIVNEHHEEFNGVLHVEGSAFDNSTTTASRNKDYSKSGEKSFSDEHHHEEAFNKSESANSMSAWGMEASYNADSSRTYDASEEKSSTRESANTYSLTANIDASLVFGAALDAETFAYQSAAKNRTYNNGTSNNASLSGNVGLGAAGNVGINVAAGAGNMQANQLALATGDAVMSTATASSYQGSYGNYTENNAFTEELVTTTEVNLSGSADGSYSGTSIQSNDVYPEVWFELSGIGGDGAVFDATPNDQEHLPNGCSSGCTEVGHIDFDNDDPDAPGRFEFSEQGDLDLDNISLSGTVVHTEILYSGHVNSASLTGSVLSGAAGNIGVNVAAGSGNLQGNSLAIVSSQSGGSGGL